eukprot:g1834.t1
MAEHIEKVQGSPVSATRVNAKETKRTSSREGRRRALAGRDQGEKGNKDRSSQLYFMVQSTLENVHKRLGCSSKPSPEEVQQRHEARQRQAQARRAVQDEERQLQLRQAESRATAARERRQEQEMRRQRDLLEKMTRARRQYQDQLRVICQRAHKAVPIQMQQKLIESAARVAKVSEKRKQQLETWQEKALERMNSIKLKSQGHETRSEIVQRKRRELQEQEFLRFRNKNIGKMALDCDGLPEAVREDLDAQTTKPRRKAATPTPTRGGRSSDSPLACSEPAIVETVDFEEDTSPRQVPKFSAKRAALRQELMAQDCQSYEVQSLALQALLSLTSSEALWPQLSQLLGCSGQVRRDVVQALEKLAPADLAVRKEVTEFLSAEICRRPQAAKTALEVLQRFLGPETASRAVEALVESLGCKLCAKINKLAGDLAKLLKTTAACSEDAHPGFLNLEKTEAVLSEFSQVLTQVQREADLALILKLNCARMVVDICCYIKDSIRCLELSGDKAPLVAWKLMLWLCRLRELFRRAEIRGLNCFEGASPLPLLLLRAMCFLGTLVCAYRAPKADDTHKQVLEMFHDTELFGVVGILVSILLSEGRREKGAKLPQTVISLCVQAVRICNSIARIDSASFYHLLVSLLDYCVARLPASMAKPTGQAEESDLLHDAGLIGQRNTSFYCLQEPENQSILCYGEGQALLTRLAALPLHYFMDERGKAILFPTILASCFKSEQNLAVLRSEMNLSLVCTFLAAQMAQGEEVPPATPEGLPAFTCRFPPELWKEALAFFDGTSEAEAEADSAKATEACER